MPAQNDKRAIIKGNEWALFSTEEKEDMQKEARLYRRTATRYMNLAIVETLRSVLLRAARWFPTHGSLVKCGEL
jgi:hypothetical protein